MNTANGTFDKLVEETRRALESCRSGIADFKESQRQLWKQWAGAEVEVMLQSPAAAERYLHHADKYIRLAALGILVFHWQATKRIAATFEQMAFDDQDDEVRGAALVALGMCYAKSDDRRIEKLFATIVRDEKQSPEFRRIAYTNIFQVRGLTVDSWPQIGGTFNVPKDVDWAFVQEAENGVKVGQ
jgi:hypothetical protein